MTNANETRIARMANKPKGGVPRGLSRTGPVLFSYGFRPFFLGGALWAVVTMLLWITALSGFVEVGGEYGAPNWHAHEMLFGFSSAVLAGFLLTAVPNWTGRLPVSGRPLLCLFTLWCAGRLVLLFPDHLGVVLSAVVDGLFLPSLLLISMREIIAGKKWRELKVLGGLLALSLANIHFHLTAIGGDGTQLATRLAVSAYAVLVIVIGGRIIPSFTHNWLNRLGRKDFSTSFNSFDKVCILIGIATLLLWTIDPDRIVVFAAAIVAAGMHTVRLFRWRGWSARKEALVLILHLAYAFIPLGFIAMAISALGMMSTRSVLHIFTVGVMGCMMLAVMTRASLGHTGRKLEASKTSVAAYIALTVCAMARPMAELLPDMMMSIYAFSALLWMLAFGLFCVEYAPILMFERKPLKV